MFRVKVGISESYRNEERPIILASVKTILKYLDMDKACKVYFNGEAEVSKLIGSNRFEKDDKGLDVGFTPRIYVEKETEDGGWKDGLDNTYRHESDPPFWYDKQTKSSVTPLFKGKKTTITINRYFTDRVVAERFINKIENFLRVPGNSTFSCNVHYPLNNQIIVLLSTIYDRLFKANKIDSTVSSLDWIKSCSLVPWDIITNVIGNNAAFVFKQSLEEIGMNFQDVKLNRVRSTGSYNGQWIVSFSYDFYHTVFIGYNVCYPIVVQQQMTDKEWLPIVEQVNIDRYATRRSLSDVDTHKVFDYQRYQSPLFFVFPAEDNWVPPNEHWLDIKVQRLALMEDLEEQVVLNLFTFAGKEDFWLPEYRKYISKFSSKVTKRHKSPMHLKLWVDNIAVVEDKLELMPNGDLIYKCRPQMDKIYRVSFYLDKALHLYDDEAIKDITDCENKEYGRWILHQVFPQLYVPGDEGYYGNSNYNSCPWIDWDDDIKNRIDTGDGPGNEDDNKARYNLSALLIARNERFMNSSPFEDNVLDFSMYKYLRRKTN